MDEIGLGIAGMAAAVAGILACVVALVATRAGSSRGRRSAPRHGRR